MDVFSNILFVKEQFAALSQLAHRVTSTDKYSPEACCIVGNYYSLKVSIQWSGERNGGWHCRAALYKSVLDAHQR